MQLVRTIHPLVVIVLHLCPASPGTRVRHHDACVKPHFTHMLHNILFTNCYKTYEILKSTILTFSNACKTNERKNGFVNQHFLL